MTTLDPDFEIKRHDTGISIIATLIGADGVPINGNASTVRFHMREINSATVKINAPARWVDQVGGIAAYDWTTPDVADADLYEAEFEVTDGAGKTITFPNRGFKKVRIGRDIA